MKLRLTVSVLAFLLSQSAFAVPVQGYFANQIQAFFDPLTDSTEDAPTSMLGAPDELHRDLDGGGVTLGFSSTRSVFDYTVALPEGTDLILVDVVAGDTPHSVNFGYGGVVDANSDGLADTLSGAATLLDSTVVNSPPWATSLDAGLLFYDLDASSAFVGLTDDFFVSIDDTGDFDFDAIQLVATDVPEPSTFALLLLGMLVLELAKRRCRQPFGMR